MNKTQVMALLKSHQNERGIQHWNAGRIETGGLKSFGIGLTQLRKLAKEVGRDHALALKLWDSDNHDAKIVGLLIDDPKKMTREQVEDQVDGLTGGYLSHAFSSCGANLAKTSFAEELAEEWITHKDTMRRCCGYGLMYELSKMKTKSAPSEAYFLACVQQISKTQKTSENAVRGAMGGALLGIGKRSKQLNEAALKVARAMGPIEFDNAGEHCEPFDVVKHLSAEPLRKKLGVDPV